LINQTITITSAQGNYICGQFWFNDSANNVNQTLLTESGACFTVANSPPLQPTIIYPVDGQSYVNVTNLNYSSGDDDDDTLTYSIYINETLNVTSTGNITLWNASAGTYNFTVSVSDGTVDSANSTVVLFTINASTNPPLVTSFNIPPGTDFDLVADLSSVCGAIIAINNTAQISWNGCIDVRGVDFDTYLNISNNKVSLDAANLDSSINTSANITLYFINITNPLILKDGVECTDCVILSSDAQNVTFNISSFSAYSATSTTNLSIFDTSDSATTYANYTVFYGNYSNSSGFYIANANCELRVNRSGTWKLFGNMTFNLTGSNNHEWIGDCGYQTSHSCIPVGVVGGEFATVKDCSSV